MADIHRAASIGDLETLKACIEQGCDINTVREGRTPIWFAADSGQLEACRFLIEKGAVLNLTQMSEGTPLCSAVEKGNTAVVALLLPHCNARWEFQTLERAICLGFHEIADLMLSSGILRYPCNGTGTLPYHVGSVMVRPNTLSHWQRFIFDRPDRLAALDPLYLEYLLVGGARAGEEGLHVIEFLLQEGKVDVNCRVRVDDGLETPLTAAAEQGNLEVIRYLLEQPGINVALCGKYEWPPFLHFLRNSRSVSNPEGLCLLKSLSTGLLIHKIKIYKSKVPGPFEVVFQNALRCSNESIMQSVIEIVRGAAGDKILPLLVRAHDKQGLEWMLCSQHTFKCDSQSSWVLICEYLQAYEDTEAFELLVEVADTHVRWGIWSPAIPMCLYTQNFRFAKQFFFEARQEDIHKLTSETLRGFNDAARNDKLIAAWNESGHANAALWDAVHSGLWKDCPEFGSILSDERINPNMYDPHPDLPTKAAKIDHKFIRQASDALPARGPIRASIHLPNTSSSGNHAIQDYQMQLMLLEQENKKRLMSSRAGVKKSLLTWAAATGDSWLVHAVLRNPRIDVNIQDSYQQTALMYAVARGDKNLVAKLLIRNDIRVNLVDDQGRSSIFYAAQGGHEDIVEMLIKTNKIYISIQDTEGRTAMDYARKEGHIKIVSKLTSRT
ncbi:ankyrin repeat-containing domain protein [Cadophora sp. MPI-SDFR-AT-0126]|nr:ankyrin repeat-containing domain protein [Leotiomycetes sp. MPI-SDFR-AT-0126]